MLNLIARFGSMFRPGSRPQSTGTAAAAADASGFVPLRERAVRVGAKTSFTTFLRAAVEAGRRLLGRSVQQGAAVDPRGRVQAPMSEMSAEAHRIVHDKITKAVRQETPIWEHYTLRVEDGQQRSVKIQDALRKDLERAVYTVGGPKSKAKWEFDVKKGTESGSAERAQAVQEAIQKMRDALGSDALLTAVSRFAHQGTAAGVMAAMASEASPVRDAQGQPVMLVPSSESTSIAIEKLADGFARVDLTYCMLTSAHLVATGPDAATSADGMMPLDAERSSARFVISLMVSEGGTAQLLGVPKLEYQITPLPAPPAAQPAQVAETAAGGAAVQVASEAGSTPAAPGAQPLAAAPARARQEGAVEQAVNALLSECLGTDPKARSKCPATENFLRAVVRTQLDEADAADDPERALRDSVDRAREEFQAMADEVADPATLERASVAAKRRLDAAGAATTDDWVAAVTDAVQAERAKASLADAAEAQLRAATASLAGRPAPGTLKAMARLVAQRTFEAPASRSGEAMKSAMDEAMRLFQEFTAVERLHPTQHQDDERPSEQVENLFERMHMAAREGRFDKKLSDLRQEMAKDLVRRMVTVRAPDGASAPEGWLRRLLAEERPSLLPAATSSRSAESVTPGAAPSGGVDLRAQRVAMKKRGDDLGGLMHKIEREIAPALLRELTSAIEGQPTRPLHELVAESEAPMREAALACLLAPKAAPAA